MTMHEQLNVRVDGSVTIVELHGQFIGGDETDAVRDTLTKLGQERSVQFVLDLSDVSYVNSSFIGVLLGANAVVVRNRGAMVLAGMQESVREVLSITKMHLVFRLHADVQEALRSLRQQQS